MCTASFHLGIDFGAKRSGTTALVHNREDRLTVLRCAKNEDADAFLERSVAALSGGEAAAIYIDAPLSLPRVLHGLSADGPTDAQADPAMADWFFRAADRALGAMSPMFLGGLSARAMKLAWTWRREGHTVVETWPRGMVRLLELEGYRAKDRGAVQGFLERHAALLGLPQPLPALRDQHELDAVLAWASGLRHRRGIGSAFGEPDEGLIHL